MSQAGRAVSRGVVDVVGAVDLHCAPGPGHFDPEVARNRHHSGGAIGAKPQDHDRVGEVVLGLLFPIAEDHVVCVDALHAVRTDEQIVLGPTIGSMDREIHEARLTLLLRGRDPETRWR